MRGGGGARLAHRVGAVHVGGVGGCNEMCVVRIDSAGVWRTESRLGGIWIVCVVVGATREAAGFERTFIHVHARLLSVPWLRHALVTADEHAKSFGRR